MSNVFVIIKICYVHNQWYDISCATLYNKVFIVLAYNFSKEQYVFPEDDLRIETRRSP